MTPPTTKLSEQDAERRGARLTLESVMPGIQVGLLLAMLPMVGWIFSLKMGPLELAVANLTEDVGEMRDEMRSTNRRIDDLASRPPNATVMAHIEAILNRLDNLERQ